MSRARAVVAVLMASALLLAGCTGDDATPATQEQSPAEPSVPESAIESDLPEPAAPRAEQLKLARSQPREDSYYPEVGDPGVDALHYGLTLSWDPSATTLSARQRLTFRSTRDATEFQLDFGRPLELDQLTVDGEPAGHRRQGDTLTVTHPVEKNRRYLLELAYGGTPEPVPVPTSRSDFSETGWTITDSGETWTMQEPWGAHTWYAVNDHPSDKALYDFTMLVPSPWTGVANGELVEHADEDDVTTTHWHLAEPAASYLTTAAFGDFELTEDKSESGVPITYWTPRDRPELVKRLQFTPEAMAWLEDVLGPYPYDTFGTVVVDSQSGMETQTMVTLGATEYALSKPVIVHELAHHWYGNQVTPSDWRDLWLNEGMVMYLQFVWEAENADEPLDQAMDRHAQQERLYRQDAGPPGRYHKDSFASSNVYYGPAVMFHEIRKRLGDETFWRVAREWPRAHDNGNATRAQFVRFWQRQSGQQLKGLIDRWLDAQQSPPR